MWKSRGPAVRCGRPNVWDTADRSGSAHGFPMSDPAVTLGKGTRCAPLHRTYYYWDGYKAFRDRGWAR